MEIIHDSTELRPIKAWVHRDETGELAIEAPALVQAKNLARLPFIAENGVALMPDVHSGIGSTVGSVIATEKAIIPAAVGVDIGCGMNAVRLNLKLHQMPESMRAIRNQIERDVPLGPGGKHFRNVDIEEREAKVKSFTSDATATLLATAEDAWFKRAASQLGTLGSGNHFIELCSDENNDVWIMLHSGSRGIGNRIGTQHIAIAKERIEALGIQLDDTDLSYYPEDSEDFNKYVEVVGWAQNYALENRRTMMNMTIAAIRRVMKDVDVQITNEAINCHHNYVEKENHFGRNMWITRKGAIRARKGDLGIIPGSMGQRSYIVRGKGNEESYCSCSHGAGRAMSRTRARKEFTVEDLVKQTEGVECRKDKSVIDEIPSAYKSIDQVMANQTDLVEVVHTLKAFLCVKGN